MAFSTTCCLPACICVWSLLGWFGIQCIINQRQVDPRPSLDWPASLAAHRFVKQSACETHLTTVSVSLLIREGLVSHRPLTPFRNRVVHIQGGPPRLGCNSWSCSALWSTLSFCFQVLPGSLPSSKSLTNFQILRDPFFSLDGTGQNNLSPPFFFFCQDFL